MSGYLRLPEPPMFIVAYPTCSACEVDLYTDGDGWQCRSCGTTWGLNAYDGARGDLPESSECSGPECPTDEAWRVSHLSGADRDRKIAEALGMKP